MHQTYAECLSKDRFYVGTQVIYSQYSFCTLLTEAAALLVIGMQSYIPGVNDIYVLETRLINLNRITNMLDNL